MAARSPVPVPESVPTEPRALARRFVAVAFELRTYGNLCYLGLQFPLGIGYFVSLVVAFSVSSALAVILVGVGMVVAVVYATREVVAVERLLAETLLGVDVPVSDDAPPLSEPLAHLKHVFTNPRTWAGIGYLLSKLAVGIASFVLLVVGAAVSGSLLFVPFYYRQREVAVEPLVGEGFSGEPTVEFALQTWEVGLTVPFEVTAWHVTTLPEALVVSAGGAVVLLAWLHVWNAAAWVVGQYTRLLLRDTDRSSVRLLLEE